LSPRHIPPGALNFSQRVRDVQVADGIAAEAGTEETPELFELAPVIVPVIPVQPRPPLATSGYFPGTISLASAAVALNTSHIGIFGSGFNRSIVRVNWLEIINNSGGGLGFTLGRVDSPFTGFPSVPVVPGYINAGNPTSARVFTVTKSDTVARTGVAMAPSIIVNANDSRLIWGPWILNNGILVLSCDTVNTEMRGMFGYETWPAIRDQPAGG